MLQFTVTPYGNKVGFTLDMLGFLPQMASQFDPRPAREQFHQNYAHGGGWQDFQGFKLNPEDLSIKFTGDPKMLPFATANLGNELIAFYDCSWVAIIQPDQSYSISRMD